MLGRAPAFVQLADPAEGHEQQQQQQQKRERPSGESLSMRPSPPWRTLAAAPLMTVPQRLRAAAAERRAALADAWSAAPRFLGRDVPAEAARRAADGTLWGGGGGSGGGGRAGAAHSINRRPAALRYGVGVAGAIGGR
jgi:hypothetical protein